MTTIILRLLPKKLLLSLLILVSFSAGATNYIFYNNTGNWTDPSRWSAYPGTTINAGDSVTITFGGNCIIPAVTNITINGTLYIQNTSTLNNLGSLLINNVLTIEQGGSLSNSGTWTYYKGKGRNSGTITTSSTGRTGIRGILINDGTITNNGTFGIIGVNGGPNGLINNSTFATINNAGLFTNIGAILNSGTFSNSGTFLDSLVFQLNDLGTFTNTGTMKIPYLGSLYINNATTVTNESTGIIQSASNISVFGSFVNNGTLNSTYQVGISGTFVNNGSVTSSYYFGTHSFGTLVNNGAITINPAPAADTEGRPQAYISTLGNSEYFANASTGVVTLTANTRLQNSDTLDNAGSILINANAAFENYFGTNRNMGVVLNSGTINNSGAVRNGGVIKDLLNSQFLNTGQMSNTGSIEEGGSFTNTGNFDNDSSLYISMLDLQVSFRIRARLC
jgi:hypothetical protein